MREISYSTREKGNIMQSLDPEPPIQKWFVLSWFLRLPVSVQIVLIVAIAVVLYKVVLMRKISHYTQGEVSTMQPLAPDEPPVDKWFVLRWLLRLSTPVQIVLISAIVVVLLVFFALVTLHPTVLNDLVVLLIR